MDYALAIPRKIIPNWMYRWGRRFLARLVVYAVLAFFHVLRPIIPVTFLILSEYRIGGFVAHTDFYLRQRRAYTASHTRGLRVALIGNPCSDHLTTMFKRHLHLYKNHRAGQLLNFNVGLKHGKSITIKDSRFVCRPPLPTTPDDLALAETPPVLRFTEAEERLGKALLNQMCIPEDAWFVCFHSRDTAYFTQTAPEKDFSNTSSRNSSIASYLEAMKYVVSCGGYALRVGSVVAETIPDLTASQIIDYASSFRSDFGDIYLAAKCKFFVGSNDGLTTLPMMFNVPVVDANSLIMPTRSPSEAVYAIPLGKRDIFLPKPIYSLKQGRLLTLREILEPPVRYFADLHEYEGAGLQVLENSSEDILGATREMNARLDGRFIYTEEDEDLQTQFRSLIHPRPESFSTFARVGAEFLRRHRDLLD